MSVEHARDAPPDHRALFWLPIAGVALGQPFLVPGVSLADVCLGVFLLLAVPHLLRAHPARRPPWVPWLAAFCAWALLGGVWLVLRGEPAFSILEFSKSAAKLVFYSAAAWALALVAQAEPYDRIRTVVLWSFAGAAFIAVALYAAMVAGVPHARDLACGATEPCNAAYYYERRWFGDASPRGLREGLFVRAVGLASEPARLGVLLSLALAYLLLGPRGAWRRPWPLAMIVVAAVLSFSLAGYAVLLPVLALAAVRLMREEARARRRALLAVVAVALLAAALPPVRETLAGPIGRRAERLLSGRGGDESARLRLVGSWDMALMLVERHPVGGVGLGHFDRHVPEIREQVPGGLALDDKVQGWNVLAYVLATTGIAGLLLFVLFAYVALKPQPALGLVFVVGMFADGTVLGPAFWVFLALYAALGAVPSGGKAAITERPGR